MDIALSKDYKFNIIVDEKVPEDELWIEDGKGRLIGKIIDIFNDKKMSRKSKYKKK